MVQPLGLQTLNITFDSGRMQVPHNPVYIFQGENVAFQIPKLSWISFTASLASRTIKVQLVFLQLIGA
jgi:hypothetical protein